MGGKKENFLVQYRVQTGLKTHDNSLASTTQVLAEITVMKYQLPSPTALLKRDWGCGASRGAQVGLELAGSRGPRTPSASTLLCWNYRVVI